jgi:exopolysaccharide biosynthesis protein
MKKKKFSARRFLSLFLGVALLVAMIPISGSATVFWDIPADSWYCDYVYDLVYQGIIAGTSSNTFSPNSTLTRGAFVTMLCKTALTPSEISQYNYKSSFKDVSASKWYNPYVNWAYENGIVSGYENNTFQPERSVTRQELAKMVTNYATAMGLLLSPTEPAVNFKDSGEIANYAKSSVTLCQRSGVISGYNDNTFRPKKVATRAEAAALYSRFLDKAQNQGYDIIRKRVNGVAVKGVVFDPQDYQSKVVLGQDMVDGREGAGSIVSRSGAKIAVNAAFFDMSSYIPYSTILSQGRVMAIDNMFAPARPAFSLDSAGNPSIESFACWYTASVTKEDGSLSTIEKVATNKWPSSDIDATRMVFTRDWGTYLNFSPIDAVTVDANGTITKVETKVENSAIPPLGQGYVLAQKARRYYEGDFFSSCKVGGHIDLSVSYQGASTQDLELSVGAGPRIVKDGAVYGNLTTYKAEGFSDPNITTYSALRCCIGIMPDGRVVIITATGTLAQMSQIMVSLGCSDAINLDGGGSANLFVNGQWLVGPQSRKLNNMIVFY